MKMILPPVRDRRSADKLLSDFFRNCRPLDFRRAIVQVARYYRLPAPKVEWYEYLDWGKTAGRTYEDGRIHMVHPENWKRGRKYKSERRWINTVYHEMGHYIFWADAERKADTFAYRMVRGLATPKLPQARIENLGIHGVRQASAVGGRGELRAMRRLPTGGGTRTRDRVGARAVAANKSRPKTSSKAPRRSAK